jgi:hypothetical protein
MRVSIGAYYFDGKPVYIVEHIEEDLSEYVSDKSSSICSTI